MINFIKFLLVVSVFVLRVYIIFNIVLILYNSFFYKSQVSNEILWYLGVLLLDLYLLKIENSIEINIYNKKIDE
jgi:hypothetical protein